MTALLDAAALAERLVNDHEENGNPHNIDAADALRLLASHARGSGRRVALIETDDDIIVSIDGQELPEVDEDAMLDPHREWLFGTECVAGIVRAFGGSLEIRRRPQGEAGVAIHGLVEALEAAGYHVPTSADWTQEINLRQVERLDSAEVAAAVAKVRSALSANTGKRIATEVPR